MSTSIVGAVRMLDSNVVCLPAILYPLNECILPLIREYNPLNLSILVRGGKERNIDSLM